MDAHLFDDVTRFFAEQGDRRRLLKTLAGSALGAGLALLGLGEAAAACRFATQRCDSTKQCCSGHCLKGRCRCPAGTTVIAGRCAPPCGGACSNSCNKCEGTVDTFQGFCTSSTCATVGAACARHADCPHNALCASDSRCGAGGVPIKVCETLCGA